MKRIGLVLHATRPEAAATAAWLAEHVAAAGVDVFADERDAARAGTTSITAVPRLPDDLDLVFVFGGDGTLLRAADAVGDRAPLLGVNFGHLGFLSELERSELEAGLRRVLDDGFEVDERTMLEARVRAASGDGPPLRALNDVIVAKVEVGRSIRLKVTIAGEPLVAWAADGVVVATATGSTAYSFSAGGPVVSPRLGCLVVTPVSAHGLFTRSVIVPGDEDVTITLLPDADAASVSVDGGAATPLAPGSDVVVRAAPTRIRLAKVDPAPFWRLVREKFLLPRDPG